MIEKNGFTLLEAIAVLMIIGILIAIAVARMNPPEYEVLVQKDIISKHLQYAQLKAMSTNTVWYIAFSANSYSLYEGESPPSLHTFPGQDDSTVQLLSGVSFSPADSIVSFNAWGQPGADSDADPLQTGDRTLTLTKNSDSRSITIVENTGLIQ